MLDLALVDLSYAGHLPQPNPTHAVIAKVRVDDPVTLNLYEGRWMILSADDRVLGHMVANWAPPEETGLVAGKVGAIVRWQESDNEESYQSCIKHEEWEMVLPEFVFCKSPQGRSEHPSVSHAALAIAGALRWGAN